MTFGKKGGSTFFGLVGAKLKFILEVSFFLG
jgi:hypothetical protein